MKRRCSWRARRSSSRCGILLVWPPYTPARVLRVEWHTTLCLATNQARKPTKGFERSATKRLTYSSCASLWLQGPHSATSLKPGCPRSASPLFIVPPTAFQRRELSLTVLSALSLSLAVEAPLPQSADHSRGHKDRFEEGPGRRSLSRGRSKAG